MKVGLPAAKEGLSEKDPTIADLLKPQGYATGQFGKNHLGDRNEFLPTVHGFDEFFGNLYHLNAEEEPEHPDYPKNPNFKAQFGPRGVLKCVATATDTPGDDPRFGPWGKQKCEDTGPLTKKRMETIDEEFLKATTDFIDRAVRDRKPFFVWFNSTRMHIWTRLKPASQGKTGLGIYPDGMVEHDGQVGQLLKKLDDLGIANNTIVIYTTDNGAEAFSWPDGGTTPFRGEKNTNWEGGYRVPAMVRWPGLVPPRTEINEIFSAEDWATTLVAAAGEPDIKNKLLQGYDAAGKTFKVHLDGYDQRDLLARKGPDKRREFFYWTDDGNLAGLRYEQWKAVFMEQKAHGFDVWAQPLVPLRLPMLFNLRSDPFERAQHEAGDYVRWFVEHAFVLRPGAVARGAASRRASSSSRRARSPAASRSSRPWRSSGTRRPAISCDIECRGDKHETDASFLRHQPPRPALDVGALPALSGPLLPASAPAQTATSGGSLPSWNDGPAKQAILDFVRATTDRSSPNYVVPGGPHRHVRSGRHALGRASDVHAGGLLPRPRAGSGGEEAGAEERRALQDRALRQSGGDRQALDAGSREDPRRDADRHDGGGVQRRSEEVDRNGQASALEPPLHRARLSADARSAALPARQRLQDLHRDRRRPGLRARLRREGLRHPARAGGRHRGRNEIRLRQGRQAVPDQGAEAAAERQQRRQARRHPPDDRPPALCARSATRPATGRCWSTPGPAPARG